MAFLFPFLRHYECQGHHFAVMTMLLRKCTVFATGLALSSGLKYVQTPTQ